MASYVGKEKRKSRLLCATCMQNTFWGGGNLVLMIKIKYVFLTFKIYKII